MCKQNVAFGIANVKSILLRMENVVVFWQRWYNFQWNVFVTGILNLRESTNTKTIYIQNVYRR